MQQPHFLNNDGHKKYANWITGYQFNNDYLFPNNYQNGTSDQQSYREPSDRYDFLDGPMTSSQQHDCSSTDLYDFLDGPMTSSQQPDCLSTDMFDLSLTCRVQSNQASSNPNKFLQPDPYLYNINEPSCRPEQQPMSPSYGSTSTTDSYRPEQQPMSPSYGSTSTTDSEPLSVLRVRRASRPLKCDFCGLLFPNKSHESHLEPSWEECCLQTMRYYYVFRRAAT